MILTLEIYQSSNNRTKLVVPNDLLDNAKKIIAIASELASLASFEIRDVPSGYRSESYNKAIGGSANSKHCYAQAIDIWDPEKKLGLWLVANTELLRERGCAMESLVKTHESDDPLKRWVQIGRAHV